MYRSTFTLDPRFDRVWRAGRASKRRSRLRTATTFLLFTFLCSAIAGYGYITDARRVKAMAETYLSHLIGGPVHVGWASLSIFEGLRLDDIRIEVDGDNGPDSLLFTAKTFQVQYSPRALLFGRIEATRILALDPRVNLCENVDTRLWNFQRLIRVNQVSTPNPLRAGDPAAVLPEIFLRNAQFDYAQISDGKHTAVGSLAIEGQLTPDAGSVYRFRLQSRGTTQDIGPVAEGSLALGGGVQTLRLRDVEFDQDLKTILPAVVRKFWEEHELAGRIDETRISFVRKPDGRPGFRVETDLANVRLTVRPEEWLSRTDKDNLRSIHGALTLARRARVFSRPWVVKAFALIDPQRCRLENVDGRFVFTEDGVAVQNLVGQLQGNRFKINGQIGGYLASSPATMRIESLPGQDFVLPEKLTYVAALPWNLQEFYYRFRPTGRMSFWVEARRTVPDQRPAVAGAMRIHDAGFRFERFPYPLTRVTGEISLGPDAVTGRDALRVVSLHGYGPPDGINAKAEFNVTGVISPLDNLAGADLVVRGEGFHSEPLLLDTMPPGSRRAVMNFDADKTGVLPILGGDFVCTIHRPIGHDMKWDIVTEIDLRDVTAKPKFFPVLLEHLSTRLVLHDREDFIEIHDLVARHGSGTLGASGRVAWNEKKPGTKEELVKTSLVVKALGIPVDADLIAALPPARQAWAKKVSPTGTLDLEGKLFPAGPTTDEIDYDFDLTLHNGTAKPAGVTLRDIALKGRLSPTGFREATLTARRDETKLAARGSVVWEAPGTLLTLNAHAAALTLDAPLLALLPPDAHAALSALHAEGKADVALDFTGLCGVELSSVGTTTTRPSGEPAYVIVVTPRGMAVKPDFAPYPVDELTGSVTITPDTVTIEKLAARRAKSVLTLQGTLDRATDTWALALAATDVPIDDALREALPKRLTETLETLAAKGVVSFELPDLAIRPARHPGATKPTDESDMDFTLALKTTALSLDAGAPVTDLAGTAVIKTAVRHGDADTLDGTLRFDAFNLAGRPVRKFTAKLAKLSGRPAIRIGDIQGNVAGGALAGQLDLFEPVGKEPARFALGFVLRDASVPELTGEIEKPIEGRVAASLALEGAWADPKSRRGRGDVRVQGREMYKVPVLFGLMQMANLSLPVTSAFQDATVRYAVDGEKVTFDQIELRSPTLLMRGSGSLDFASREVRMNFTTDNPALGAVPILGDFFRGASRELMQLRVRGTLEEPKVGASAFNTMTTTIDEVLKGKSE